MVRSMNVKKTKKFKENHPENYHVHDRDLHSEVSSGHISPPPLESCSSRDSFVSFWDELNAIVSPTLPPVKQEGSPPDEAKGSDEEASEEEWEDVGEGDDGGSIEGGESVS